VRLPIAFGLSLLLLTGCTDDSIEVVDAGSAKTVTFPDDFLFGTAEAAWQVEGDFIADGVTPSTNWSIWTQELDGAEGETNPRGVGFYELYEEDLDRAQSMGVNAFRMGIEWARIEPKNDEWNQAAIDHYVKVIKAARKRNMQVMITFWHWVVPDWISDPRLPKGNPARDHLAVPNNTWLHDEFEEFVAHVVPHIKDDVDLYSVLNEPWSVIAGGYVAGVHPPGDVLNIDGAMAVHTNLIFMQARGGKAVREFDDGDANGDGKPALVGQAKATSLVLPLNPDKASDVEGAKNYNQLFNATDIDALTTGNLDVNGDGDITDTDMTPPEGHYPELANSLDWLGIQYYGPIYVLGAPGSEPPFTAIPVGQGFIDYQSSHPRTEMESEIRPAVYLATLEWFWNRYKLPIYLTENGTGDCDDNQRPRHMVEHVYAVGRAMQGAGVDIRGYFHWSLTDNFEWAHGTKQCFGLYAVNYDTLERTKRRSADVYAGLIAKRKITAADYLEAYLWGYGTEKDIPMEDTLAEIEREIANGPEESQVYYPVVE
jgi:beta-glucosidase/6-phospho-beta-glucosidase/beta-galactosidase